MSYADITSLQREVIALRNRVEAADAAFAEIERNLAILYHSQCVVQEFLLRHITAQPPIQVSK